jgi:type VI secretion system ImpM family protein
MTGSNISIYGKIPAARDFVRQNSGDFQKAGFDSWFQQGIELLHTEKTLLSEEPVYFSMLSLKRERLIGVFCASQDAVGRKFPLIISTSLPTQKLNTISLIPLQYKVFFEAATQSLTEIYHKGMDASASQISHLESSLLDIPLIPSMNELLEQTSIAELKSSIGDIRDGGGYAFNTLTVACDQVRSHPSPDAARTVTLECPAPTIGIRTFWLELIQREIGSPKFSPSFFWTTTNLLVALGPPPPQLLAYLANSNHKGSRYWPLRTQNNQANEAAVQALTKEQTKALSSNQGSLWDILEACSHEID